MKVEARDEAGNKKERTLKFQIEDGKKGELGNIDNAEKRKQIKFVSIFAIIIILIAIYMHNDQKRAKK